ncbi:hypothetical protein Q8A67_012015 [Cirrhinus molitorella]|uniref:Uncharacterized protein n=1 Tax=Cirrhinus molitorella TaxID=172907 RepID=A0AA88TQ85_9TELE|nr:hypothetical protein Q8A67_012015 [Cirrhinus molitorella]
MRPQHLHTVAALSCQRFNAPHLHTGVVAALSYSLPKHSGHCDGGTASESEEESAASTVPPSDPDIPMAIATPASPPGADDSGSSEGRTVPLSGSVEVPCHELTSPSDVPVQAPRRCQRSRSVVWRENGWRHATGRQQALKNRQRNTLM